MLVRLGGQWYLQPIIGDQSHMVPCRRGLFFQWEGYIYIGIGVSVVILSIFKIHEVPYCLSLMCPLLYHYVSSLLHPFVFLTPQLLHASNAGMLMRHRSDGRSLSTEVIVVFGTDRVPHHPPSPFFILSGRPRCACLHTNGSSYVFLEKLFFFHNYATVHIYSSVNKYNPL